MSSYHDESIGCSLLQLTDPAPATLAMAIYGLNASSGRQAWEVTPPAPRLPIHG